jgi:hypothetical protein
MDWLGRAPKKPWIRVTLAVAPLAVTATVARYAPSPAPAEDSGATWPARVIETGTHRSD